MSARGSQRDADVEAKADTASNELADRQRVQALLSAQRRSLQLIAGGASLTDVLLDLCDTIDAQAPAIISAIFLMEPNGEQLRPAVGRRLPEEWANTITPLPVGPQIGAVGTAAFRKKPVITSDIASDPLWTVVQGTDYKNLALKHGLRAALAYPLISKDDEVLGAFAIYYPEPKKPTDNDIELIEAAANIAVIAIESDRSRAALEQAFEDTKNSEAKLRQVIDTIPALVWCNLPDGPNDFLNKRWLEYTGLSPDESHGWGWQAAFHPEDLPLLMERWVKMLASGKPDEIEARLRRHDGVYRWFLIRAEPFRDESGKIVRWYGTSTDIDDRKRAEEALQSNERNLSLIINTMPTQAWSALPDGSVDFVNQRWLNYTGLSPEQALGWGWNVAIHPDDLNDLADYWRSLMHTGEPGETETRFRRFDGEYRWFLFRANAVRDESGTIVKWYGTNTDIDDRKRAEAQVEQAYLRLAQAQRLSKTGSFITDLLADEHNWSEELCRIFDFDPGSRVTTDAIRAVFHPEDRPVYEDAFKRAVDGRDRDIDIIYRIITPSGNVKHLHAVTHTMEKIAGRPVYIGAIQDVTESKVAEEALTRARSELAHMARVTMLSALTASIAHEINQPISAVITSADACLRWLNRDKPEVQRARDAAMRISDDGKRAAEIISHLKSFYKKDASPQREVVSVNDVVGEMLVLLRSEAGRHSVAMRTELAADLPSVSADRVQLQQVLMNLMLNGMEAMNEPGGELKISTRRAGGEVMASVSDTGVGIPPDKMEQIFEEFFTTKAGGTGMGLAICRAIIESHGGRLWASVNAGHGATIHFTLPTEHEAA